MALLSAPAWAQVALDKAFVAPPFAVDETVVGKGGWELTNPPGSAIYTNPDEAMLTSSQHGESGQETTLHLQTAIRNSEVVNPGNNFTVDVQLALTWNQRYRLGGGVYFIFSRGGTGPFDFGFAYGTEEAPGGLYYQGSGDRVIALPLEEMAEREPYRFVITVDTAAETFKVAVTGKNISGEAVDYQSEEIEFNEKFRPFTGETISFFIGNDRPTLIDAYVDHVKILPQ